MTNALSAFYCDKLITEILLQHWVRYTQRGVSNVKVGFALSKVITAGIWGISFNQKPITFFKKENRGEKTNKRDIILILLQAESIFVSRTC